MGKINVLSFEIANLIAAGEVVERPASVLKELIENSIDSGADTIVAEIKRGGVSMIRVTDNGCGIDKDDLPVALKRHATSKIKEKDDLDTIMTLGFRGEALAAISSVSSMTIITKTKDAEVATMLTAEAGKVVDLAEVQAADGTTVVVSDLFYNVPARRKFLKKDSTEAMNVVALVERVALSRPDISIQMLVDGEERFKTPGDGELLNTIYSIFGKDFSSKLIKVDGEAEGITVTGFVGRSDNVKKNRNLMNVFINGRYVKSLTAQAAIEKAFTSYIAPECFPVTVLFIDMNPLMVDVNVHPAKLEVKFSDERTVFEIVYHTIRKALEEHEYRPEMDLSLKKNDRNLLGAYVPIDQKIKSEQIRIDTGRAQPSYIKEPTYHKPSEGSSFSSYNRFDEKPLKVASSSPYDRSKFESKGENTLSPKDSIELLKRYSNSSVQKIEESDEKTAKTVTNDTEPTVSESVNYRFAGELFDCYLLVEQDNSVLVIDKHAAHERIIFEDLKRSRNSDSRVPSQSLLLPITVMISPVEQSALSEYRDEIESLGFEIEVFEDFVNLLAIPDAISANDAESLIIKMADDIAEGKGDPTITDSIRREKALYQIACKAAIKGGRKYDESIHRWLIEKVLSLPDITVCPHGRPIAYKLKKSELDRQFDRLK